MKDFEIRFIDWKMEKNLKVFEVERKNRSNLNEQSLDNLWWVGKVHSIKASKLLPSESFKVKCKTLICSILKRLRSVRRRIDPVAMLTSSFGFLVGVIEAFFLETFTNNTETRVNSDKVEDK